MSVAQNLSYAAIQVIHNFGAVAVVAGSLFAVGAHGQTQTKLAYIALTGWVTQAVSGATFGMVSWHYYHHLPDLSGIALYALATKMICATLGILVLTAYLWRGERWTAGGRSKAWISSSALAIMALSAAAFLRWFS